MDKLAQHNQERWTELISNGVDFGKPFADYDAEKAFAYLNQWANLEQIGLTDFTGKQILCLASGGGQQSVCFSLLGANVTVFDLTPAQLASDRAMAQQYGYSLRIEQGDMRDLSRFADGSFDIIYQPYSINNIPDPTPVIDEVARLLRPQGLYYLQFSNPHNNMDESDWDGRSYPLLQRYEQGTPLTPNGVTWQVWQDDDTIKQVEGPQEFTHTWGTLVNGLGNNGLYIFAMIEVPEGDPDAEPGSWEHFKAYLPLWPAFWAKKVTEH